MNLSELELRHRRENRMTGSARQLAALVAAGGTSAEEQARLALDRISQMPWVGALVEVAPERVLEAARQADKGRFAGADSGRLAGVVFAVKDNIDVAGWPTTACTPALASNFAFNDAEVFARLKAAGALVLGKAMMHELAMGGTSDNPHMWPVRNPHAPDFIPGGSSGGTAAAIAAGFCTFGLGSDTGGSVPIPSSLCGIAGLRPTVGRYPAGGLLMTNPSRDVIGPMAARADDLRLIDAIMSGQPEQPVPALDGLQLAVPHSYFWEGADQAVQELLGQALKRLAAAGVVLVHTEVRNLEALNEAASAGFRSESALGLPQALAKLDPPITVQALIEKTHSPAIAEALAGRAMVPGSRMRIEEALQVHRPRLRKAFADALDRVRADALLVPTTPLPAVPIGSGDRLTINGQETDFFSYTRATLPAANAGLPFLSIPAGTIEGLPIGLGLIAGAGEDALLLALGAACEAILSPEL